MSGLCSGVAEVFDCMARYGGAVSELFTEVSVRPMCLIFEVKASIEEDSLYMFN
jgi:hypothetical protein